MKLNQTKSLPYIFLIIFVFLLTYLWNKITIPFNEIDIIGVYSKNNHHSMNDVLRYLSFILVPFLSWLVTYFILKKKKIK